MGVLFEMENNIVDVKGKFFRIDGDKSPRDFKVSLIKRDEPAIPNMDTHGFTPKTASRNNMFGPSLSIALLEYDVILKIGDDVLRMPFHEFNNLTDIMQQKLNKFQRLVSGSVTSDNVNAIINAIQQREQV